jgi:hypothetical protein
MCITLVKTALINTWVLFLAQMEPHFILRRIWTPSRATRHLVDALSAHCNIIRCHDSIKFMIGKMLTTAGSSCVFLCSSLQSWKGTNKAPGVEKAIVAETGVLRKADISTSIRGVNTDICGDCL